MRSQFAFKCTVWNIVEKQSPQSTHWKTRLREVAILKSIREFLASVSVNPTISNVMESHKPLLSKLCGVLKLNWVVF